ncbi:MAG: long-chain fatty acid--CoA ligase [Myxococcota bacterium]|nr:long-chain fatty acid--CoA ligase [Myxococcota bacterium]
MESIKEREQQVMYEASTTIPELFIRRVQRNPNEVSVHVKEQGKWQPFTWGEAREAVENIASGLLELSVKRGDCVAILSTTRREWSQIDIASMYVGGITVGIYPTLTVEQTAHILEHSNARLVFVEDSEQFRKVQKAASMRELEITCVTICHDVDGQRTLESLIAMGARRRSQYPSELTDRMSLNKSSDVVTYVYTSGTTGEPKGAMLTHQNFVYVIYASIEAMGYQDEVSLSFLPLAHSLQRYANYLALIADVKGYFAESLDKVPANIREVQPTCFATVPRILEKIHAKVYSTAKEQGGARHKVFQYAMNTLAQAGRLRRAGQPIPFGLRIRRKISDRLVGAKVRDRMGGRVRWLGCGGAPLVTHINEFFDDIGVPVLEGYGLTETSAPVSLNTLHKRKIGTVGMPLRGTHVRISDEGEIQVKGPGIFKGYFKNEEATKQAFTDDHWFRTGDIGFVDNEGFLVITDRLKDLIITAGGKNIAPQPIEAQLTAHPWVSQAVVIGDRKPYLVALMVVDSDLKNERCSGGNFEEEFLNEARQVLSKHVDEINKSLPKFQQLKRWELLLEEMTIESGELTPTLKVKRRVVYEKHARAIDSLYMTQ